ncbi:MAG TPA: bifunctional diaminohydroxyphosphoribosylaminopyrimidine deaminase/5-amino-6-(5-phosphoribosylamino)uracil reductase RibD, partial [Thermodesulfobacteriota bacterium]|nr:bifunctional diaminohydroxyphosphoribosylaminopyrimidine deaminase/5-amino-6-(5-phosphoribosylamino)uracil reductase RibD [Thermodesulfobacteriota bacterium]
MNPKSQIMQTAIALARKGIGKTSPNPAVGAVIVKNGRIIGKGYHKKAGRAHAEINALKQAGIKAKGAEMYVTLEPCNHFGRTPPCTDVIIKAGIKKVFIGMKDPNPLVSGKGIRRLRSAGMDVEVDILEDECRG